jgi:DNA-binding response OmpR family regulator
LASRETSELREQLRQLRASLLPPVLSRFPAVWKLTPCQATLLDCLLAAPRGGRSYEVLRVSYAWGKEPQLETLKAMIWHLRKKLARHGVDIHNVPLFGYELPEASKQIIREAAR